MNKYNHSKTKPLSFLAQVALDRRKSANNVTVERMYGAAGNHSARIFGGVLGVFFSGEFGTITKTNRAQSVL